MPIIAMGAGYRRRRAHRENEGREPRDMGLIAGSGGRSTSAMFRRAPDRDRKEEARPKRYRSPFAVAEMHVLDDLGEPLDGLPDQGG